MGVAFGSLGLAGEPRVLGLLRLLNVDLVDVLVDSVLSLFMLSDEYSYLIFSRSPQVGVRIIIRSATMSATRSCGVVYFGTEVRICLVPEFVQDSFSSLRLICVRCCDRCVEGTCELSPGLPQYGRLVPLCATLQTTYHVQRIIRSCASPNCGRCVSSMEQLQTMLGLCRNCRPGEMECNDR